jgi:hypothetical protein
MNQKPKRRDAIKAVAAAGGLLVLGGVASAAEPDPKSKPAGEWLNEGREAEPCAIFQQGRILLLVNEAGQLATARMTEAKKFVTVKGLLVNGEGWEEGLVGEITDEGKAITWANGSTWKRP